MERDMVVWTTIVGEFIEYLVEGQSYTYLGMQVCDELQNDPVKKSAEYSCRL